jgi:hypothetical protein
MATTRVIMSFPWSNNNNGINDKMTVINSNGLTDYAIKVAKKELREDKSTREQALQQMRDWLKKNYDVENVRTDDSFLLRFLRTKKFSVPMAQQQLLKYLNVRRVLRDYFTNLDIFSPGISHLINSGYIVPSPVRDKNGRRVIFYFVKKFDPTIVTSVDMGRAHVLTYETLVESQENQVLGILHVADFSGISTAHINSWNPTDFMRGVKWGEQSFPVRHKNFYLYNLPTVIKYVIDAVKAMVSAKIKERLNTYTSFEDVRKKIDPEVLPKELGGNIPLQEMIDLWKAELVANRDRIMSLDKMKILSDRGIKGKRNNSSDNNNNAQFQDDSICGSFRKLEID